MGNPRARNLGKESSNKKYQRDEKRTKHTLQELPEELMMGFTVVPVSVTKLSCALLALKYKKEEILSLSIPKSVHRSPLSIVVYT